MSKVPQASASAQVIKPTVRKTVSKTVKKVVKTATVLLVGGYLLIWTLVWGFSPLAANYFIAQYLQPHNLFLADDTSIRFNPFMSSLTINNLALNTQTETVFALPSLVLKVSALDLLSNQINVETFLIDGLSLVVEGDQEALTVAGFAVPLSKASSSKVSSSEASSSNIKEPESAAVQNLLQLIMPKMQLTNANIELRAQGQSHVLQLKDLSMKVVKITPTLQNVSLNLLAQFNDADVSLQASTELINQEGDIQFEVNMADVDLQKFNALLAPYITLDNGFLSYKGQHTIQLTKQGLRLQVRDLLFATQGIEVNKKDIHLALAEHSFTSPLITVDLPLLSKMANNESRDQNYDASDDQNPAITVSGSGNVVWQDLHIFNQTSNQILVAIAQLGLQGITFASKAEKFSLSINNTRLKDTFFSNDTENEIPALALFKQLIINDIELNNDSVSIDTIDLAGVKSNVQLSPEKQIKNLIMTVEEISQALTDSPAQDEKLSEASKISKASEINEAKNIDAADGQLKFQVSLNKMRITDSATVQFNDRSVSPHYARYAKFTELSIGPIDNLQPSQTTVISVKGSSNQYASFDVLINAKPFLTIPEYSIQGQLNQMELAALTAYVKDALGYEIESGQLDLKLEVELLGTKIKGNSHILLRGIELSSLEDYEKNDNSSNSYIPFNTALGMLKDSDGNVDLNLPISGDTSSPSFGLSGFVTLLVKRATIATAKDYLTMTFVPYASLVKIVIAADKHLLKLEISNLNYTPTAIEVGDDQQEFITTFSELLTDKSDLQIKLCGVSTAADIGKERGEKLTAVEIEALIKLSEQRGNAFKQYMVEEKHISSSRLLLCKPRIDNRKEAVPHIKFEV